MRFGTKFVHTKTMHPFESSIRDGSLIYRFFPVSFSFSLFFLLPFFSEFRKLRLDLARSSSDEGPKKKEKEKHPDLFASRQKAVEESPLPGLYRTNSMFLCKLRCLSYVQAYTFFVEIYLCFLDNLLLNNGVKEINSNIGNVV